MELYTGIQFSFKLMSRADISSVKKKVSRHETVQVVFRVPEGVRGSFQDTCQELGYNASEVLRSLMTSFVRLNQDGRKND